MNQMYTDQVKNNTETIDFSSLFVSELTASGSFDLREIKASALNNLLEALSVPSFVIESSFKIRSANNAFKILAKEPNLEGRSVFEIFGQDETSKALLDLLSKVYEQRKAEVLEQKLHIGNATVWGKVHFRTVRLIEEHLILAQIENLTAERQLASVEKYQKLVQTFPIGVAEFVLPEPTALAGDVDDLVLKISTAYIADGNSEFAKLYRRKKISKLQGVELGSLFPLKNKAREFCFHWVKDAMPIRSFITKEGGMKDPFRHFENTFVPNIVEKTLTGFWWLKKDISEMKKFEDERLKTQKLESLGILAGGIAHDFNNLLTGILGNVSVALLDPNISSKTNMRLQWASKAVARAQELTNQLLTFAKGGVPVKTVISPAAFLIDCTTFSLRGSNVRCEFDIPGDCWPIEADVGQLGQVVNNLVINAAQAMPNGGIIRIQVRNVEQLQLENQQPRFGKFLAVSVIDHGIGIEKKNIRKIFDPYFTTKKKGSGLGLATAYSIIKQHEGFLVVKSKWREGSTFTFYLPATSSTPMISRKLQKVVSKGSGRILVMDDEAIILDMVSDLLGHLGYESVVVTDGEKAIEAYVTALKEDRPFRCVVMDLTIPGGLGGEETIKRLRAIDPEVVAIASTGYSNSPVVSDPQKYGFKGILPKPYDAEKLSDILNDLLRTD